MDYLSRKVLCYLLERYHRELDRRSTDQIDPFFIDLFTHTELVDIVRSMFLKEQLDAMKPEHMTRYELLEQVSDDAFILGHFLSKWKKEQEDGYYYSESEIQKTLLQLGHASHYLGSKPTALWNRYDLNNYRALLIKAGKLRRVYGIYDSTVEPEDAATVGHQPSRYFESYPEAQNQLEVMIAQQGFSRADIRILPVLIPV